MTAGCGWQLFAAHPEHGPAEHCGEPTGGAEFCPAHLFVDDPDRWRDDQWDRNQEDQ